MEVGTTHLKTMESQSKPLHVEEAIPATMVKEEVALVPPSTASLPTPESTLASSSSSTLPSSSSSSSSSVEITNSSSVSSSSSSSKELISKVGGQGIQTSAGKSLDESGDEGDDGKFKKRKVVLLICYSGTGYQGLQINPGAKTIEKDLFDALHKAGAITDRNHESLQKNDWVRCARTDKGVHALGNVISCKLEMIPDLVEEVNKHLVDQIRVLAVSHCPKKFSAKNACFARTYEYICPVSAFLPAGKKEWTPDELATLHDKVNPYLEQFVGSFNYHNFTPKANPSHASSLRNILSFKCSPTYTVDGVDFVSLFVKGQSFMLHQIRKMVAVVIWSVAKQKPLWVVKSTLMPSVTVNIFMVPGDFLTLRLCHYDEYFELRKNVQQEGFDFEKYGEVADAFKKKFLIPHMVRLLKEEHVFANWMRDFGDKMDKLDALESDENQEKVKDMERERVLKMYRKKAFDERDRRMGKGKRKNSDTKNQGPKVNKRGRFGDEGSSAAQ